MKKKESKGPEFSKDGRMRPLLLWVFEIAVVLVLAAVVSIFLSLIHISEPTRP